MWLAGYKTYIVAALTIAKVIIDYLLGHGLNVELLAIGLSAATLRNGIANK